MDSKEKDVGGLGDNEFDGEHDQWSDDTEDSALMSSFAKGMRESAPLFVLADMLQGN